RAGRGALREAQLPGRARAGAAGRAQWQAAHLDQQVAGGGVDGATQQQPLPQFRTVEQATLGVLPAVPYDLAIWKAATLHRDCYVTFAQAYYSAPYRLVGQQLWVRGGSRTVELYTAAHELVATHDRATAPGERKTNLAHRPPEKV